MLEDAPQIGNSYEKGFGILTNSRYSPYIQKANKEYYYWDKAKYHVPKGLSANEFWVAVKCSRIGDPIQLGKYTFMFKETPFMGQAVHELDLSLRATDATKLIEPKEEKGLLLGSLMEEAIASSQMEGANTTRVVAKEMLRKNAKPKDKSQRMIANNYRTIRFVAEHKDDDLSTDLILGIHGMITEKTLGDAADEGRFRTTDSIVVADGISGEVAHRPPPYENVPKLVQALCRFANEDRGVYLHPIIKAIVIHFMVSFIHPFVDGNGRTARTLFFWYMLKCGYSYAEFLAVSRIIYRSKSQYERAFLYTEHDGFDLGYFVNYNLKVIGMAFEEFKAHVEKGRKEILLPQEFLAKGLNERQIEMVRICTKRPNEAFTAKQFSTRFDATAKTLRSDLKGLVEKGILEPIPLNKRLVGYRAIEALS